MTEREALERIVKAWESLPGPGSYSRSEIEEWICGPMVQAINDAREVLRADARRTTAIARALRRARYPGK